VLANITVVDADLLKVRPDIKNFFLYEDQTAFDDEILEAKRQVFREIKDIERAKYTDKDEQELGTLVETLTDLDDEPVKDRIVLTTIYLIFSSNNLLELANAYYQRALNVTLAYNLDSEVQREMKPIFLGR